FLPIGALPSPPPRLLSSRESIHPHAALLRQAFAHCGKFPTAASRRSLGRVSVPVFKLREIN
ncbi:unnamed protein product, partial [Linum tenue]